MIDEERVVDLPANGQAQDAPAEGETGNDTQAEQAGAEGQDQTQASEQPKPVKAGEGDGEGEDGESDQPRRPTGSQRLKRRLAALAAENEDLRRKIPGSRPEEAGAGEGARKDKAPREEDFPDYLAYERAKTAWETRQAVREEFEQREARERESRAAAEREEQIAEHEERLSELRASGRIPDFDTVMKGMRGVQIRQDVAQEIMASEKSALLAYHLAKNPETVRELNAMSGRELARAIGRLEGSVRMPAAKTRTGAPKPPTQVRGSAAAQVDPNKGPDDMESYVAWRRKQQEARA